MKPDNSQTIFMSHNWGVGSINHNKVAIINKQLKTMAYSTWFDGDKMFGNITNAMANGIEQSAMALIFVTREYMDKVNGKGPRKSNDNCFLEYKHCVTKLTAEKMLCVVMEEEMRSDHEWEGVLGMHMSNRIYVDMSGDLTDDKYLYKAVTELRKNINIILGCQDSGEHVATIKDENHVSWLSGEEAYYAHTMDEDTEEILSEMMMTLPVGGDVWTNEGDFSKKVYQLSTEKTLRIVSTKPTELSLQKQPCRVDIDIKNKDSGKIRKLEITLQLKQASHQCSISPPGNGSSSAITVLCHINEEKDRELIFKGCKREKTEANPSSDTLIALGGGTEQNITNEFNWTDLCIRNGFFVTKEGSEDYDDMVIHFDDWENAAKSQWKKCFSLGSQIVLDTESSRTSYVTSAIEKKIGGNGLFVFTGYDLEKHALFLDKDDECNAPGKYDEATETTIVFVPSKHAILLVQELTDVGSGEIKLYDMNNALNSLSTKIGQFLRLHHKYFSDTQLLVTSWMIVPIDVMQFEFPPCCSMCYDHIFFNEDLQDEDLIQKRWDLVEKKVHSSVMSYECREGYKAFLAHLIGFLSTTNTYLPNPADSTATSVKKIFLTKTQRKLLSVDARHAYITGGYGSGKSVILQVKLAHMIQHLDSRHKIVYVSFNRKSLVVQSMAQLTEDMRRSRPGDNTPDVIVGHNVQLAEMFKLPGSGLKAFIQMIQRKNESGEFVYHLIADEYDPSTLTLENALSIKSVLESPSLESSVVWVASIPMMKRRTKITMGNELPLTVGYHLPETGMVHLQLGCVFRFTEEIYQLLKVGVDVLKKNKTRYHYKEDRNENKEKEIIHQNELDKDQTNNKEKKQTTKKKTVWSVFSRLGKKNADDESKKSITKVTGGEATSKSFITNSDSDYDDIIDTAASISTQTGNEETEKPADHHDKVIEQTKGGLDELDHLFKVNQNATRSNDCDTQIETSVDFWESQPSVYNVSGETPLLISLHKDKDIKSDNETVFRLYLVLVKIVRVKENSSVAIMVTNSSEVAICEQALQLLAKHFNVKYAVYLPTLRPEGVLKEVMDISAIDVILSDTDGLTGLEYDKVIIPLSLSEDFLSSALARTLSRSQNYLFFVILPMENPSSKDHSITKEIVDTWKNMRLVKEICITMESCLCARDDQSLEVYFCKEECNEEGITLCHACPRSLDSILTQLKNIDTKDGLDVYKKQYEMGQRNLATVLRSGKLFREDTDEGNTDEDKKTDEDGGKKATSGDIVTATYAFTAQMEEDLSFNKGDWLQIVNTEDENWWFAKSLLTDAEGYIPSNYVILKDQNNTEDWFHGEMSRAMSEKLLSERSEGTFLIRIGESKKGYFVLSVQHEKSVKHYRIQELETGRYCFVGREASSYQSLNHLVEHHGNFENGLACVLTTPCPKASKNLDEKSLNVSNSEDDVGTTTKDPSVEQPPWFHKGISREIAEKLLSPRKVGLYLVRESVNHPGDYTLSVVSPTDDLRIEHYRIISKSDESFTVDEEEFFSSLIELIEHYKHDADGLCTRLLQPRV